MAGRKAAEEACERRWRDLEALRRRIRQRRRRECPNAGVAVMRGCGGLGENSGDGEEGNCRGRRRNRWRKMNRRGRRRSRWREGRCLRLVVEPSRLGDGDDDDA